jgi:hypothetical protein
MADRALVIPPFAQYAMDGAPRTVLAGMVYWLSFAI